MDLTIGVDVGGTKIAAGVVDEAGTIVDRVRISTPTETAEGLDEGILEAVGDLTGRHRVAAVGVAAAGYVDERRSQVRFSPNLPWRTHPLADRLQERIGLPVVVENDANSAAWAEHRFGAGRGVGHMVMLTVGTGLGGGIVIDGFLLRGAYGIASEWGHVRVVPEGRPCGCGQRGCWEQYASGRALVRAARALAGDDPVAAAGLLSAAGSAAAIDGHMVTAAAAAGDPTAVGLLADLGTWLGEGIAAIASVLDPALVVVGGGVAEAGELLLGPARAAFAEKLSAGAYRPHLEIREAVLGNDAGIIGAADLARSG